MLTDLSPVSRVLAAPDCMLWFNLPKLRIQHVCTSTKSTNLLEESLILFADDNVPAISWCLIEADLFIVVACMPAIHAALRRQSPGNRSAN